MRLAPPPNPVAVAPVAAATGPMLPGRLTRSKMTRKPAGAQPTSVPSAAAVESKDNFNTPTPLTDGYAEPETPATVIQAKGLVFCEKFNHLDTKTNKIILIQPKLNILFLLL